MIITNRIITRSELRAMVPYTPQHILRLEKQGKFPKRIQVGEHRVGWLLTEIEGWIAERAARRYETSGDAKQPTE